MKKQLAWVTATGDVYLDYDRATYGFDMNFTAKFVPLTRSPYWHRTAVVWDITIANARGYCIMPWQSLPDAIDPCRYGPVNCRCPKCYDLVHAMITGKDRRGTPLTPPTLAQAIAAEIVLTTVTKKDPYK